MLDTLDRQRAGLYQLSKLTSSSVLCREVYYTVSLHACMSISEGPQSDQRFTSTAIMACGVLIYYVATLYYVQ